MKSYIDKEQQKRIDTMEQHYATLNSEMSSIKIDVAVIKKDVCVIKDNLGEVKENLKSASIATQSLKDVISSRPTWLTTGICTLLVGLIIYLLTH